MKKSFFIGFSACLLMSFSEAIGQDLHFSQFGMTPLHLNAAEAGGFPGKFRAFANYKSQWQGIGNGYRTFDLAFDTHLFGEKWENSTLGLGAVFYRDVAGALNFGNTQARVMLSYHTLTSDHTKLSAGIGGGYVQQSVDKEKMKWGGQYDGTGYDPDIAVQAEQGIGNSAFLDLNSGLRFTAFSEPLARTKNTGWRVDAGVAAHHLHEPEQEFLSGDGSRSRSVPRKYVGYLDGHIGIGGSSLALRPGAMLSLQGPSQKFVGRLMFRYLLEEGSIYTGLVKGAAVSLGVHYRSRGALVPALMLDIGGNRIGVSYDINLSPLSRSIGGRGGLELSFRFQTPNPFQKTGKSGVAKFL